MRTIVIAPHPDDEVLGVGGTVLRRKAEGGLVGWLIVTSASELNGWNNAQIKRRNLEIALVKEFFAFDFVYQLEFPATKLDLVPTSELVGAISKVFKDFEPEEIFLPHPSDVHSDHRLVFGAVASCTKWFRYPSVKRVLAYETLSETDFSLDVNNLFRPNVFIDIESFLMKKLDAAEIYTSEINHHPFPRSIEAIRALAILRGSASGYNAAEAFELLRERA